MMNDGFYCVVVRVKLISFKRDKNIVRSAFQTSEQPGTFKCARTLCKTCPFILQR